MILKIFQSRLVYYQMTFFALKKCRILHIKNLKSSKKKLGYQALNENNAD